MRILTLISVTATAALIAGSAIAAPDAPASAGSAAVATTAGAVAVEPAMAVETISRTAQRLKPFEAASLAGDYALSDGSHLRVSYERHKLFADIGERRMELTRTGSTTFIGRGTPVSFTFNEVPFATDVTVRY